MTSLRFKSLSLAVGLSLFSVACGDDDSSSSDNSPLDGGRDGSIDAGGGLDATVTPTDGAIVDTGTPPPPAEAPIYALVSVPAAAQGAPTTSYLIVTDKLTGELPTSGAQLEVAGNAIVVGLAGGKRVFVGTDKDAQLKRYDLAADGKLKENGGVNFQAKGVQTLFNYAANFQFVSATKAYYLSLTAAKLIPFNPDTLALGTESSLPELVRPIIDNPAANYTVNVTGSPIRKGNKIYWGIAWDTRANNVVKFPAGAAVVVLDTTTDTAKVVKDDGSCGYTRDGVASGDWIYFATESAGTAIHYLDANNGPKPCMRRFNTVTEQYDAAWKPDFETIAGGPAGSIVTSPSGQAFTYVLDKSLADPKIADKTITNPRVLAVSDFWKRARLIVGDSPSVQLLDLPPTSGSALPHNMKDFKVTATFGAVQNLREVTDNGVVETARASAKLFGNTASIVQVR